MISSQFKKYQLKKFGAIIGFTPERVLYLIDNIDVFYREWFEKKFDKKKIDFKKFKDGTIKQRVIRPSSSDLKLAQHRIKNRILTPIQLPKNVHGGVKGCSNITNAKPHQGNKYVLTTDLQDFYPSITSQMVYDTFLKLGYSNHFAGYLCKLTTWKHSLPQGTPTSTHISNVVFLQTDYKLINFCNLHNITYTRYIDDLTFSCQQDFQHLIQEILNLVINSGFKISYRKTKYSGNQNITGIDVFLNKIDAPQKIKEKAELEIDSPFKPVTNYLNNIRKTNKNKGYR